MTKTPTSQKVIIIGSGPHFRSRYYEVLEKMQESHNLQILLIVDLINQKEKIKTFFHNKAILLPKFLFLPEEYRNIIDINLFDEMVKSKINISEATHILICTEPKVHKIYALWAIENNLDVFIDKPLSAFLTPNHKTSLYKDYLEVINQLDKKKVNVVLSCERRSNLGYHYLIEYLKYFIKKYQIPITYIDIHFGGGNWVMPNEFFIRENHPFKYGYGVLLHSGYHYIDLLISLLFLNKDFLSIYVEDFDIRVQATYPYNVINSLYTSSYKKLFKTEEFNEYITSGKAKDLINFGETDITIIGQLRKDKEIFTSFNIKLLETTLSRRISQKLPSDPYLASGRIRQENVIIHLGHLCSIHLKSLPYLKLESNESNIEDFVIEILNNPMLSEEKTITKITRDDLSSLYPELKKEEKLNIKARQTQLSNFLCNKDTNSTLKSHQHSINFLNQIMRLTLNENIK